MAALSARPGRPLAVAHRGAPYRARENTLPALGAALEAGADAVEFDVRLTRDGVPVLLHDDTLWRLWGHDEALDELTYEELRLLTGGGVPTLGAALEVMGRAPEGVRSFIDLPEGDPRTAKAVVAEVAAAGAAGRVYYCGSTRALLAVKEAEPEAETALSVKRHLPRPTEGLLRALEPRWFNYRFGLVAPETVRRVHDEGRLVSVWTADRPRTMRRLAAMGVDSITSNRIGALRKTLDRLGR
ncbi:glycerophosphodiester phosphodiesterase [Streptomyces polyrhachis]|uniref:Glycerophosphodiester phosphodiesterase n=1 Tax=Streptomyces polyrhachis TaxID=1282885 RepID=A0ABW2GE07_9ACTN